MEWVELCEREELQDLPYKIETNRYGEIVMSPASNRHGYFQTRIAHLLLGFASEESRVISECSIATTDGVKVADVAWLSPEFWSTHTFETPYSAAPEICVEVKSPSNSHLSLEAKTALFFEAGAKEVWLCDQNGSMTFLSQEGPISHSSLLPDFPDTV